MRAFRYPIAAIPTLALMTVSLTLAGCQKAPPAEETAATAVPDNAGSSTGSSGGSTGGVPSAEVVRGAAPVKTNLIPPAPGEPGGLPNDRTPIAEGKIDPKSPQGAAAVVERYASLLEQGQYDAAYAMWGQGGNVTGLDEKTFKARFAKYSEVHTMVGAPTEQEGAAGSLYITVPMQIYGRMKDGGTFNLVGPIILKRVNDVDGATPAQLQWHLSQSGLKPEGSVREEPAG